jgi:WD40 repeat protein
MIPNEPEITIGDEYGGEIESIDFSPDGRFLAFTCVDGSIKLWNVPSRTLACQFGGSAVPTCVRFSPSGRLLAAAFYDHSVRIWDMARGILEKEFVEAANVRVLRFSPDETLLAAACDDYVCMLYRVADWVSCDVLMGHTDWIRAICFSPDGRRIATGSDDKTVMLWNVGQDSRGESFLLHYDCVMSAVFTRDGGRVVSGDLDGSIYLWDVCMLEPVWLSRDDSAVHCLALDPSDEFLASGGAGGDAHLRHMRTGELVRVLENPGPIDDIAFSPDGVWLAIAESGRLRLWRWGYPQPSVKSGRFKGAVAEVTAGLRASS